jgi:YegS/Rv2252/BmrU family lipid kinase
MTKIAFIINPKSGTGRKNKFPDLIHKYFSEALFQVDIHFTEYANHGYLKSKEYVAEGYDAVVAIGGDGTVNEVARAVMGSTTALGIVPCGSGNGLALHLKIPLQASAALKRISKMRINCIDAGLLNNQPFFCTAGIGYDAYIANRFAEAGKRGPVVYMGEVIFQYFDYKTQKYKLTFDDDPPIERTAFLVTFANASQWGNNASIAPNASVTDGYMDVVVMSEFPIYVAPKISLRLFTKQLDKTRYVEVIKCKKVVVEREKDDYVHYDGEPGMMGEKLEVQIVPKALRVLI